MCNSFQRTVMLTYVFFKTIHDGVQVFGSRDLIVENDQDMCLNECFMLQTGMFHLVCFEMCFYYVRLF
jgi:hypothetical protein